MERHVDAHPHRGLADHVELEGGVDLAEVLQGGHGCSSSPVVRTYRAAATDASGSVQPPSVVSAPPVGGVSCRPDVPPRPTTGPPGDEHYLLTDGEPLDNRPAVSGGEHRYRYLLAIGQPDHPTICPVRLRAATGTIGPVVVGTTVISTR